jgi:hypothetical protein
MFVHKDILVNYSLDYRLKGELNWYFDLYKNIKSVRIVDFPVVNYMLGGVGDINYRLNVLELIKVQVKQNKLLAIVSLPFLIYNLLKRAFN